MLPLSRAPLGRTQAVFSDVDGTLTTGGVLRSQTIAAMERLKDAGLPLVLVTGRPAGWAECWLRSLPVDGVVAENGGLYFARRGAAVVKVYAQGLKERVVTRRRLERAAAAVAAEQGARLTMDSRYTEVDLAIDYNEAVHLGAARAQAIVRALQERGVSAVRSSVHVNCWVGQFNKLAMVQRFVRQEWRMAFPKAEARFVYAGDSLNDAPMFQGFTQSVGVANVREVWDELPARPRYVTRRAEGRGFEELVGHLIRGRR